MMKIRYEVYHLRMGAASALREFGRLLKSGAGAMVLASLTGCGAAGGEDKPPDEPRRPSTALGAGVKGCYHPTFAGAQGSQFGCGLRASSGNPQFDQALTEEILLQRQFFGDQLTQVYLFDECSVQQANAFATPDRLVVMGLWLMQKIVFDTGSALPIAGVLAHELGHRLQFENGWMVQTEPTVRRTELEADMWSGMYMAFAKRYTGAEINTYFQFLFSLGDYNFHDRNHHGTPNQRLAAGAVGFEVARAVADRQIPADARALHDVFVREVDRLVRSVGASGAQSIPMGDETAIKQLDGDAAEIATMLDREWIDGVAAGERTLDEKLALSISDADRVKLAPYH